jgi:cation transport ATPase
MPDIVPGTAEPKAKERAKPLPPGPDEAQDSALTAIVSIENRGQREVVRLGAGLAALSAAPFAQAVRQAARSLHIRPAKADGAAELEDMHGVLAYIEGRRLALGCLKFLDRVGALPHLAELHAAERIEDSGGVPYFICDIGEYRCLGILGIREEPEAPSGEHDEEVS